MKNTLHVVFTTTSPQYTAFPDGSIKEDGKLVSLTHKKSVNKLRTACHPANGFRGAFRRYAAKAIEQVLIERGEKISAETYVGLHCGSATAQPDNASNSIEELVRASKHVYMGLFGGGSRLLPSKYSIQDLDIICAHNVDAGVVSTPNEMIDEILSEQVLTNDDGITPKSPYHYLERAFFTKVDDIARGVDMVTVESLLEDGIESAINHVQGNIDSNAKRKVDLDAKKKDVSNVVGIERVKIGTPQALRIDIDANATDEQIGLLLICVESMINENYIGGNGRIGYGKFKVESMRFINEKTTITQLGSNSEAFKLSNDYSSYVGAAKLAIANIDLQELQSYFAKIGK